MINLLTSLVDRTFDRTPVLQRRKATLFEPPIQEINAEAQPQVQATKAISSAVDQHGSEPQQHTSRMTESPVPNITALEAKPEPEPVESTGKLKQQEDSTIREEKQTRDEVVIQQQQPPRPAIPEPGQLETIVEKSVEREVVIEKVLDSKSTPVAEAPRQSQPSAPIRVLPQQQVAPKPTEHHAIQTPPIKSAKPRVATRQQTQRALRLEAELPSPADPPVPTINVTIGRVEVRASTPSKRAEPARATTPKLSLEDYLQGRSKEN